MSYLNPQQTKIVHEARMNIRALNHPLRQQILEMIKSRNNRINVSQLYKSLKIEQSVASAQLALLRSGGFVKTNRDGRTIWYSVDDAAIKDFIKVWEKEV